MHLPLHTFGMSKTVSHLRWNFMSMFTEFPWPWRQTLTNWMTSNTYFQTTTRLTLNYPEDTVGCCFDLKWQIFTEQKFKLCTVGIQGWGGGGGGDCLVAEHQFGRSVRRTVMLYIHVNGAILLHCLFLTSCDSPSLVHQSCRGFRIIFRNISCAQGKWSLHLSYNSSRLSPILYAQWRPLANGSDIKCLRCCFLEKGWFEFIVSAWCSAGDPHWGPGNKWEYLVCFRALLSDLIVGWGKGGGGGR